MSGRKYNLQGVINRQRDKASSYIDGDEKRLRDNYRVFATAIIRFTIKDGDLSFFDSHNEIADIVLELAGIDRDYAYELTEKAAKKLTLYRRLNRDGRCWKDSELERFYTGELTAKEISVLTGISTAQVYFRASKFPSWKIKPVGRINEAQNLDMEKLEKWL